MALKKNKGRYKKNTYLVYGLEPLGNHFLNLAMNNDRGLTQYISKNNLSLSKLPKNDAIKLIKSHATTNWAKEDLKKVNSSNTKSFNLKRDLRNFNG